MHTQGSVTLKDALVELKQNSYVTALVCGNLRTREMAKLPSKGRWCWKVGDTLPGLGGGAEVDAAAASFQAGYDARLSLSGNSCRDHTAAMVTYLTGATTFDMPE